MQTKSEAESVTSFYFIVLLENLLYFLYSKVLYYLFVLCQIVFEIYLFYRCVLNIFKDLKLIALMHIMT